MGHFKKTSNIYILEFFKSEHGWWQDGMFWRRTHINCVALDGLCYLVVVVVVFICFLNNSGVNIQKSDLLRLL